MTTLLALTMFMLQTRTASMEGFVVRLGTGDGIPNARVILSRIDGGVGQGYAVTASGGGKPK